MTESPPSPNGSGTQPSRWSFASRVRIAIAVTLAAVVLPLAGPIVVSLQTRQGIPMARIVTAVVTSGVAASLWAAWGAVWLHRDFLRWRRNGRVPRPEIKDPDLLRALLSRTDLGCERCGYDLRGLTTPACPECHHPVRLWVSGRSGSELWGPVPVLILVAFGIRTAEAAFLVVAAVEHPPLTIGEFARMCWWDLGSVVCLIGIIPALATAVAASRSRDPETRRERQARAAALAAGLLVLALLADILRPLLWRW